MKEGNAKLEKHQLSRQTENYRDFSTVPTMKYDYECMCLLKLEWLIIIRLNSHTM